MVTAVEIAMSENRSCQEELLEVLFALGDQIFIRFGACFVLPSQHLWKFAKDVHWQARVFECLILVQMKSCADITIDVHTGANSVLYKGYKKAEMKLACICLHKDHHEYARRLVERSERDDIALIASVASELHQLETYA